MGNEKRVKKPKNDNTILYVAGAILVLLVAALVVIVTIYNMSVKKNNDSSFDSSEFASLMQNTTISDAPEITSASTEIGKGVNEVKSENSVEKIAINTSSIENKQNTTKKETASTAESKEETKTTTETTTESQVTSAGEQKEEPKENKVLEFTMPVQGEIIREFAKENLVYSDTLEEWITHNGIDIKAEQTTIVQASEDGKIKSIKNDPRYGLTIQIEHTDGYITVYSNLLTSEFVVEGEEVKKGQTIGTVGNTAAFEISDENHLHFEILKDNTAINPTEILK